MSHCAKKSSSFLRPLMFWGCLALPELVLHIACAGNPATRWNSGLLLSLIFALPPAVLLSAFCCLIPRRGIQRTLAGIICGLWYLLCASQLIYYKVFGTFYTFYSMTNGTGALQFQATIWAAIAGNLPALLIMAIPMAALLLLSGKRFRALEPMPLKSGALLAAAALLVQLLTVLSLPLLGGTGDGDPYGLYHHGGDIYLCVNRLGLFTAFRQDVARQLTGSASGGTIILEPLPSSTPEETTVPTEDTTPTETTIPEPTIDTSPNVLEIPFEELIAQEDNSAISELHQYFASRTPSNKNEKTGLFAGSNLILITAEAYSHLAVSEELTPTLYKLTHEGFYFSNYYVPDWGVSTTDGEYAFLTGTIPKSGVWSFAESADNAMPLTMNQQLMGLGYSSWAYHGHTYNYYDRDEYLTNLGYDYKGYGGGLDVTWQWPESDVEVVDLSTADYVNAEPFSVYYMTISGHREFNFMGNMIAYKNRSDVAQLPYSEAVRAYLACQLELERSMALLLERLEEAGVLDNTVIVLTADHYPNGLTPEEIGELLGHTPEANFELFRNGCIIYKPGMTPETIDAPVSHLDLLPTISNLFGLEFDSRLYMGRDVFSDAELLICFRNRSWITDKAMYNSETGELTNLTDTPVTDAYAESVNRELSNRFAISARILEADYWNILF